MLHGQDKLGYGSKAREGEKELRMELGCIFGLWVEASKRSQITVEDFVAVDGRHIPSTLCLYIMSARTYHRTIGGRVHSHVYFCIYLRTVFIQISGYE